MIADKATDILIDTINCVARNHQSWELEQKTKGGISGYNAGCGNVQTYDGMDIGEYLIKLQYHGSKKEDFGFVLVKKLSLNVPIHSFLDSGTSKTI